MGLSGLMLLKHALVVRCASDHDDPFCHSAFHENIAILVQPGQDTLTQFYAALVMSGMDKEIVKH